MLFINVKRTLEKMTVKGTNSGGNEGNGKDRRSWWWIISPWWNKFRRELIHDQVCCLWVSGRHRPALRAPPSAPRTVCYHRGRRTAEGCACSVCREWCSAKNRTPWMLSEEGLCCRLDCSDQWHIAPLHRPKVKINIWVINNIKCSERIILDCNTMLTQ